MTTRACDDGYPSCREAEASGAWCKDGCNALLRREIEDLKMKRAGIRDAQMRRYDNGSASRRRTTTSNAEADRINERIEWLKDEIRRNS